MSSVGRCKKPGQLTEEEKKEAVRLFYENNMGSGTIMHALNSVFRDPWNLPKLSSTAIQHYFKSAGVHRSKEVAYELSRGRNNKLTGKELAYGRED